MGAHKISTGDQKSSNMRGWLIRFKGSFRAKNASSAARQPDMYKGTPAAVTWLHGFLRAISWVTDAEWQTDDCCATVPRPAQR